MSHPLKKLYIETLGCAMNVRDTEHIIAELSEKEHYETTPNPEEADLILINTCSVREKPVDKLFSELGQFNLKKKPGAKVGVCGCTASHLGGEIIKKAPFVNFVLGARNVSKITDVLHREKAVEIDLDYDDSRYQFADFRGKQLQALINISIGCDKECTYCIVPHTRGEEVSIPPELIISEVKRAVTNGAKEVMLLGQNVNNYGRRFSGGGEKMDFADLLERVAEVAGLERIRFTSPHPLHMDDRFLKVFAENPKVVKHIHMPLQSGSTAILKAMKRGYSKEWFLDRAAKVREMAGATIGTDIIVGFPGESDSDFEDTMDVLVKVRFEQVFSFKYSPRPLTKAALMTDVVPDDVASARLTRLQDRHKVILKEAMHAQIGRTADVLFEEVRDDGRLFGRGFDFYAVVAPGAADRIGRICPVKITGVHKGALQGEIV